MTSNGAGRAPAGAALDAYLNAFAERDVERLGALFEPTALVEFPMLKPDRLVGADEIARGHHAVFESLSAARFETEQSTVADAEAAMWLGKIVVRHGVDQGGRQASDEECHDLALAAFAPAGKLRRLTWYMNGRNIRRWSDKRIL